MPTDLIGNDLWNTIRAIYDNKGAVFYDKIRPVAAGTGTGRTSMTTTYAIPQRAKEIIALKPQYVPKATIAAVGYMAEFDIQGQSYAFQPMNVYSQPAGANLGALAAPFQAPSEWWQVRIPCAPNDQYDWGVTPQVAVAANAWAGMEIMYSTVPSGLPTIYGFATAVQTIVATVAGDQAGGTLTLPQADSLVEVAHFGLPSGVQVAGDTLNGDVTYASSAMTPLQQLRIGLDSQPPGVGASFQGFVSQTRREPTVGVKFTVPTPTVTITANVTTAITNTSFFGALMRFTKQGAVATAPKA